MSDSTQNQNTSGKRIKNILIQGKLSKGGMGEIYKGLHTDLDKEVVLKKITIKTEDAELRFKNEAKVLIDLHHENIVPVFDYFSSRGLNYILMDFIDGKNLREIIENYAPLPNEITLLILHQILKGFSYFHQKGVIHRDIKPENIIISKEGVIKIVDFGIASSETAEKEYDTGDFIIGTPKYIPPEIFKQEKPSAKSDIYSLGIMLYELLIGYNPFEGLTENELIAQKMSGKIKSAKYYHKEVSGFFNKLIKKMVHKNPKKRGDAQYYLAIIEKKTKKIKTGKSEENYLSDFIYSASQTTRVNISNATVMLSSSSSGKLPFKTIVLQFLKKKKKLVVISLVILIFFCAVFYLLTMIHSKYLFAVLYPYRYAPLKIDVSTDLKDPYSENLLATFLNGKKIPNHQYVVTHSGINSIEIYYRSVYIYKEIDLLSYQDLSLIKKSMPAKKFNGVFSFLNKKPDLREIQQYTYYKELGSNYKSHALVSPDFQVNIFNINRVFEFLSTESLIKYQVNDSYTMDKIEEAEIYYYSDDKKYILMDDEKNDIPKTLLSFRVSRDDYYIRYLYSKFLGGVNYLYPVLEKRSGTLLIQKKIDFSSLKINGLPKGWIGKDKKEYLKYLDYLSKFNKLYLAPGIYYLSFSYKFHTYIKGPFFIKPGENTILKIEDDGKNITNIYIDQED